MAGLRMIALSLLALWIGGLAALGGIAAPIIFAQLESHDPHGGRELAGAIFGAAFQRFEWLAVAAGALLILILVVRTMLGPRPRRLAVRMQLLVLLVGIAIATAGWIAPAIDRLRLSAGGPMATLSVDDPRRVEFARLHGISNGLAILSLFGALSLLWLEAQDGA